MSDLLLFGLEVKDGADVRPLIHDAFMWLPEPEYPITEQFRTALAEIDPEAQRSIILAYGLNGCLPVALANITAADGSSVQTIHSEGLKQLASLLLEVVVPKSLVGV